MTDPYPLTLALALALAVLALAAALWFRYRSRSRRARTIARLMALAAIALDLVSVLVHLVQGHRPGSATALPFTAFVAEHPAFAVVLVLATLALVAAHAAAA